MSSPRYWIDPEDVKFDSKMSQFNTAKSASEYQSLKYQITNGVQEDPILIRGGLCGDGVHRTRIAKELGRKVLAEDVDPNMTDKEYIIKCNKNTFGSRNLSTTQKAIKAYMLTLNFGYTDAEAIRNVGLPIGTKNVGHARTIAASPIGKELDILGVLDQDKAVTINGKTTKSIDVARRLVKLYEEESLRKEAEAKIKETQIDYNELVNTESGKDVFWAIVKDAQLARDAKLKIIDLINAVYIQPIIEEK